MSIEVAGIFSRYSYVAESLEKIGIKDQQNFLHLFL
jgi:hypothetical protein